MRWLISSKYNVKYEKLACRSNTIDFYLTNPLQVRLFLLPLANRPFLVSHADRKSANATAVCK